MIHEFERKSRMDILISDCNMVTEMGETIVRIMYKNEAKRLQSKFPDLDIQDQGTPFSMSEGKSLYCIKKS